MHLLFPITCNFSNLLISDIINDDDDDDNDNDNNNNNNNKEPIKEPVGLTRLDGIRPA